MQPVTRQPPCLLLELLLLLLFLLLIIIIIYYYYYNIESHGILLLYIIAERRKVNVLEITCLRSLVGVSQMDRVRNEEVLRRDGRERELVSRADQTILSWFGHVERMDEYRMASRVLRVEVSGGRVLGRPRLAWMDGVKVASGNSGTTVEAARQCVKDRKEWRALVDM